MTLDFLFLFFLCQKALNESNDRGDMNIVFEENSLKLKFSAVIFVCLSYSHFLLRIA